MNVNDSLAGWLFGRFGYSVLVYLFLLSFLPYFVLSFFFRSLFCFFFSFFLYLFTHLFIYLFIYLFVYLFISLFTYLFIYSDCKSCVMDRQVFDPIRGPTRKYNFYIFKQ